MECSETDNGEHVMMYVIRPASFHNGIQISEDEKRGICQFCGHITVESAN